MRQAALMGRKKKATMPENGSPTSVQPSEPYDHPQEVIATVDQEKTNGTVTLGPSNVTIPESIKSKADAGVVFGEEARQNRKTFTAHSKISDKGMGLKFVSPTVIDGVSIAKFEKYEVVKMNEIWMNAVIVYVVGQNPTLTALKSYIMTNWNLGVEPQMFKHEEGYFVVKMGSRESRDIVVFAGPHLFYGKPMIIKPWTANFNFRNEVLKVIPIWIKLPNLPLNCWSEDSLSRIGSLIGVPLYADECTSKALRVS